MERIVSAGLFAIYTVSAGAACLIGASMLGALATAAVVFAAP